MLTAACLSRDNASQWLLLPLLSCQAGDDKKLVQAASRKKKLEERLGPDENATGRKFKVNWCDVVVHH